MRKNSTLVISPVVYQKLIKISYPSSALLPEARKVDTDRVSQLAYTCIYNSI